MWLDYYIHCIYMLVNLLLDWSFFAMSGLCGTQYWRPRRCKCTKCVFCMSVHTKLIFHDILDTGHFMLGLQIFVWSVYRLYFILPYLL